MGSREVAVLKGITLEIEKGDFVAIMGPSGSGKSTLLHLAGGLDRPTSGVVFFGGQNISLLEDSVLAKIRNQSIGFVFQNFFLLSYYSAVENVALPLWYAGTRKTKFGLAQKLLDYVGLSERKDHRPCELSGGEQQRVAIARALINEPLLLCADEPTGNLDSENGKMVMGYMREINSLGTTIILITHDPEVARQANRTLHMRDGRLYE